MCVNAELPKVNTLSILTYASSAQSSLFQRERAGEQTELKLAGVWLGNSSLTVDTATGVPGMTRLYTGKSRLAKEFV